MWIWRQGERQPCTLPARPPPQTVSGCCCRSEPTRRPSRKVDTSPCTCAEHQAPSSECLSPGGYRLCCWEGGSKLLEGALAKPLRRPGTGRRVPVTSWGWARALGPSLTAAVGDAPSSFCHHHLCCPREALGHAWRQAGAGRDSTQTLLCSQLPSQVDQAVDRGGPPPPPQPQPCPSSRLLLRSRLERAKKGAWPSIAGRPRSPPPSGRGRGGPARGAGGLWRLLCPPGAPGCCSATEPA